MAQKQVRYLLSGGLAAATEYALFALLFYLTFSQSRLGLAQALSYLAGLVVAFTLHAAWTFRPQQMPGYLRQQFILYSLTAIVNLLLSSLIIKLLYHYAVPAWLAKGIVMAVVVLWNYAILNSYIFQPQRIRLLTLHNIKQALRRHLLGIILAVVMIIVGCFHIFLVRPGVGHDEEPHIAKAEATSRLDFLPQLPDGYGYFVSRGSEDLYVYVVRHIQLFYKKSTQEADATLREINTLGQKVYRDTDVTYVALTGAGGYHSINYIPNAIGLFIARQLGLTIQQSYYAAKLSALFFCTAIVVAAFTLLRNYRSRFLIAITALFPPILFSFSGITTDGFLNAASLLFAALLLRSFLTKSPPSILARATAYILAIILPITKLPYLLISLVLFFSPLMRHRRHSVWKNSLLAAALVFTVFGWNYLVRDATNLTSKHAYCCTKGVEANSKQQLVFIAQHPDAFAGSLGHFFFHFNLIDGSRITMPQEAKRHHLNGDFIVIYLFLMALVSFYAAKDFTNPRLRRATAHWMVAAIATVGGIIVALYAAANSVGQFTIWGVQTRYFYPLVIFILCFIAAHTSLRYTRSEDRALRPIFTIAIIINVFVLVQLLTLPQTFTLTDRIQQNAAQEKESQ